MSKFKAGDIVESLINCSYASLKIEDRCEIIGPCIGDPKCVEFRVFGSMSTCVWYASVFKLLSSTTTTALQPKIFIVGDRIVALNDSPSLAHNVKKDDIGVVVALDPSNPNGFAYVLERDNSPFPYQYWGRFDEFELAKVFSPGFQLPLGNSPYGTTVPSPSGGSGGTPPLKLILRGWYYGIGGSYVSYDDEGDGSAPVKEQHSKSCECGSSAVGSSYHSTWCPLFKKEGN